MADVSFLRKYLPAENQEPWLVAGRCRVFFNPQAMPNGSIHLIRDYFPPGYEGPDKNFLGGKSGIIIDLPKDLSAPVQKGTSLLKHRAEAVTNPDGSTSLNFDLYKQHVDSGGYFTRVVATIQLGPGGQLKGFKAEQFMATRPFIFFGPMRDFKHHLAVSCEE